MRYIIFIIYFLLINYCKGQHNAVVDSTGPILTLEHDTVDYGTIPHYAEGIRYLKFTNTGKQPLMIRDCRGSDPIYCSIRPTNKPIQPGQGGTITIHWDTRMVGHFWKTSTITSNAINSTKIFYIIGKILPDNPNAGIITFEKKHYSFGDIPYNTIPTLKVKFTNTGREPLIISGGNWSYRPYDITYPKDSVKPGQSAELIYRDTNNIKGAGDVSCYDVLHFESNGCYNPKNGSITIDGNRLPDPDRPILKLNEKMVRYNWGFGPFATINIGKVPYTEERHFVSFKYINVGKKPLLIKNFLMSNPSPIDTFYSVKPIYPKVALKSKQSDKMEFSFKSYNKQVGWFFYSFEISTNYYQTESLYVFGYILPDSNKGVITFQKDTFDFGSIERGKPYTKILTFKNTGKDTLKIDYIRGGNSTGVSDWTKAPIPTGKTSTVTVHLNVHTDGDDDCFMIQSNAEPCMKLVWIKWEAPPVH